MNRLLIVAAAVLIPAATAMAGGLHNHAAAGPAPTAAAKTVGAPVSPTPATEMMQANTAKLHEQMKAIRQSKDPGEKAKLMHDHMQAMQVQMQSMQSNMEDIQGHMSTMHGAMPKGAMGNGMMGGGMKTSEASTPGPMHAQMMAQLGMMQDQMSMMQGLMDQIRDHQDAPMSANKK
ncbi:MAG: hypothetical protein ABIP44_10745 [Pseudoxanthomonas sp.]